MPPHAVSTIILYKYDVLGTDTKSIELGKKAFHFFMINSHITLVISVFWTALNKQALT